MDERGISQLREIACQQILREDASVYSVQWMMLSHRHSASVAPSSLLERYLAHVRRYTPTIVRPAQSESGLDLRLLAFRTPLISFAPPYFADRGATRAAALRISGGLLVQPGEGARGELCFITEQLDEGVKVIIELSGYCPLLLGSATPGRWRKLFYRLSQALIHRAVTTGYLGRLYCELEGHGAPVRVIRVSGSVGEDI